MTDFPLLIDALLIPFRYVLSAQERLFWMYLVTAIPIAFIAYLLQKEKFGYSNIGELFLGAKWKEIILHRSARVDYGFFVVNRILMVLLVLPIIFKGSTFIVETTTYLLSLFNEPIQFLPQYPYPVLILYTVVAIMVSDFVVFITHFIQHKVDFLWEFHKVHHSAEVLTPITVYRVHPIDEIFTVGLGMIANSVLFALFLFFFDESIQPITVVGLNMFLFLFYVLGFNLRHSPVFVSYGEFWEKVFISPGAHQIHHSNKPEHVDKNFGFIFSFWDVIFKSRVDATPNTDVNYGIGAEGKEMQNVFTLYLRPFKKSSKLILKRFLSFESNRVE